MPLRYRASEARTVHGISAVSASVIRSNADEGSDRAIATDASAYGEQLRRALSFTDLVVYGMVFMLPIAPFSLFGIVQDASHGMVPLAYVLGAVIGLGHLLVLRFVFDRSVAVQA